MLVRAKQLILILTGILSVSIIGCGKTQNSLSSSDVLNTEMNVDSATAQEYWVKTDEQLSSSTVNICFKPMETIPILLNGDIKGYMSVNWVQRLGIWDYTNVNACIAGVKSSYTINTHVDFSESMNSAQNLVLTFSPYLINSEEKVYGTPCYVGWSGFSQTAQFYDNTTSMDIEFGLQPETLDETDLFIKLEITDNQGNVYEPIYLSSEYLVTAEDGPDLITTGSKVVHTINDGSFEIGVDNVTWNRTANNYEDLGDTLESSYDRFYDIIYHVKYLSSPKNDREDLLFDSNNGNQLRTQFVIGVNSDVDNTFVYRGNENAYRRIYSDEYDTELYVTKDFPNINIGEMSTFVINRLVPKSTGEPMYLRIYFEFPEEVDARSLDELKSFDGRFFVIQTIITERDLPTLDEVEAALEEAASEQEGEEMYEED